MNLKTATRVACALALLLAATFVGQANEKVVARIALVSDPHVNRATNGMNASFRPHLTQVISQVNTSKVDFVLIAGDLAQGGKPEEFDDFRKRLKEFRAPVFYVPGNHDVGNKKLDGKRDEVTAERVALFEKKLGHSFYVKKRKGVRIVGINASLFSSGLLAQEKQWKMLEKLGTSSKPTVAFMHYVPFTDKPDEKGGAYWNIEPQPRKRLLDLLKKAGVRTVLSGHLHRQLVNRADGVLFVTTPPVSFGLPKDKQREGWTLVTLPAEGEARFEFRYIDR